MGRDGPRYRGSRGRPTNHEIRYDILDDPDKILEAYQYFGSFYKAGRHCHCDSATFRTHFLKHGHVPSPHGQAGKIFWAAMMQRAYKKVKRVPERCPPNCPGWAAEPDCLAEGQDCIFPIEEER